MNIKDLTDLINIRNYVSTAINNSMIDKKIVSELYTMQINLDKKIVNEIVSPEFKRQLGFWDEQMKEVVREAAKTNNIKTGMKPSTDTVVVATPGTKPGATAIQTDKT